ncbi:hypothetical protein [Kitasatospora sp. NPDC093558]|uniref:hypothetical protein n=1 Tax=Kitasatospora sp. NPDC093558 TaxID=3155201 RepID=UPI003446BB7A
MSREDTGTVGTSDLHPQLKEVGPEEVLVCMGKNHDQAGMKLPDLLPVHRQLALCGDEVVVREAREVEKDALAGGDLVRIFPLGVQSGLAEGIVGVAGAVQEDGGGGPPSASGSTGEQDDGAGLFQTFGRDTVSGWADESTA